MEHVVLQIKMEDNRQAQKLKDEDIHQVGAVHSTNPLHWGPDRGGNHHW